MRDDEAGEQRRRVAADLVARAATGRRSARAAARAGRPGSPGVRNGSTPASSASSWSRRSANDRNVVHVQLLVGRSSSASRRSLRSAAAGGEKVSARICSRRHALVHEPRESAGRASASCRAGTGHDDERPVRMSDGRLLRAVQAVEGYGHRAPRIRRSVPLPDSTDWLDFCRRAAGRRPRRGSRLRHHG